LITYLNKQLNEKPAGVLASTGFSTTTTISKPPTGSFKPSFTSVDSLSKTIQN